MMILVNNRLLTKLERHDPYRMHAACFAMSSSEYGRWMRLPRRGGLVFNDYFRLLTAFLTLASVHLAPLGQQGAAHVG
jgi:hypothetical protein